MDVRTGANEDDWVKCPRCVAKPGMDPSDITGSWCSLCLSSNHPSRLFVYPSTFTTAWHKSRGQQIGRIPAHVAVRYALSREGL